MPIWEIRSSKQYLPAASSTTDLSFQYTDAQIAGMTEANLSVWSRPIGQPCADWIELGGTVNADTNTIVISGLTDLRYQYTLADSAPSPTAIDVVSIGAHQTQGSAWPAVLLLVLLALSSGLTYWLRRRGQTMV